MRFLSSVSFLSSRACHCLLTIENDCTLSSRRRNRPEILALNILFVDRVWLTSPRQTLQHPGSITRITKKPSLLLERHVPEELVHMLTGDRTGVPAWRRKALGLPGPCTQSWMSSNIRIEAFIFSYLSYFANLSFRLEQPVYPLIARGPNLPLHLSREVAISLRSSRGFCFAVMIPCTWSLLWLGNGREPKEDLMWHFIVRVHHRSFHYSFCLLLCLIIASLHGSSSAHPFSTFGTLSLLTLLPQQLVNNSVMPKNQGHYYNTRNQRSIDGRRLDSGMTRAPSPVYLQHSCQSNYTNADELTILQYSSPAGRAYAEKIRQQQEEYTRQQAQPYHATSNRNVEKNPSSIGTQQVQQHGSRRTHVPPTQGSIQGQDHFPFLSRCFTYYWHCCQCEYGGASVSLNDKCPEPSCQHTRCDECLVARSDIVE
ncbi:hypothetical protein VTN00DRAFT_1218 [Thermoascus crustaceus]|uniref:uncharacterized protein n=1 Tax=Thermoascus crustaceus TaxID=5088 RepID=UPI003743039A